MQQGTYNLGLKRLLSFKAFKISCVFVFQLHVWLCATCVSDAYGYLKRVVGSGFPEPGATDSCESPCA